MDAKLGPRLDGGQPVDQAQGPKVIFVVFLDPGNGVHSTGSLKQLPEQVGHNASPETAQISVARRTPVDREGVFNTFLHH